MISWTEKKVKISKLLPYERNPRKISAEAYEKLKKSVVESGYHQRIIATPDLKVIGGHQRLKVLNELGIKEITVLTPDRELTSQEYRRILIQDNLAFGEFDIAILSEDFQVDELEEWGIPDGLLRGINKTNSGLTDPDEIPPTGSAVVSVMGDIWEMGAHRLRCGKRHG